MYIVTGQETGELGFFKTLREAKKAIKEANKFDMEQVGETDTWEIEEVEFTKPSVYPL